MQITKCDRCGKIIENGVGVTTRLSSSQSTMLVDLCEECEKDFNEFLKAGDFSKYMNPPVEEETEHNCLNCGRYYEEGDSAYCRDENGMSATYLPAGIQDIPCDHWASKEE